MKKKISILFTFILLLVVGVGCGNSGGNSPSNNNNEDPASSGDSQFVEYGVAGHIVEITTSEDEAVLGTIRVEGTNDNGAQHSEAVVTVMADTKIYLNDLTDFGNLEIGMYVNVFFEGDVRESFPVQATAQQINIIPEDKNIDTKSPDEAADAISDNEGEYDGYPIVTRPDTKEITTFPEGMEEVNTYHLLNEENLPFTTYIRENFEYELLDKEYGKGITISPQDSEMINVDIVFFDEHIIEAEARRYIEAELENTADVQEFPQDEDDQLEDWQNALFVHAVHGAEEYGEMSFGQYEDTLFYIYSHYAPEAGDGWHHIHQVIKDEWQWKETEEPLVAATK